VRTTSLLVADAIDLVVFISGRGTGRRLETIAALAGLDPAGAYDLRPLMAGPAEENEG
jgi:type IV secretion system protein VirB11